MHKKLYHIIITHSFADFHIFFVKKDKKTGVLQKEPLNQMIKLCVEQKKGDN